MLPVQLTQMQEINVKGKQQIQACKECVYYICFTNRLSSHFKQILNTEDVTKLYSHKGLNTIETFCKQNALQVPS